MKKSILFIGEGATLAHVVRPLQLALELAETGAYDVHFACDPRYRRWVPETAALTCHPIVSIAPETFLRRVYRAQPLYTFSELADYAREDLALLDRVRPDAVIGDFRLSLGVTAELSATPYLALSNAHWSPRANLPTPVPEHPLVKMLGVRGTRALLTVALPLFFRIQARGFNRLRKTYGLAPVRGRGAHEVFTRGTRTLYLDIPDLYDLPELGPTERYIGPVNWTPACGLPAWWDEMKTRPGAKVLVTPGSSGDPKGMRAIVETIAGQGVTVAVATAGRMDIGPTPANVYTTAFLPMDQAMAVANAVVCNGGSGMAYQALARGKPVLGIPRNADQYYMTEALERKGAGLLVRSDRLNKDAVAAAIARLLNEPQFRENAQRLERSIRACQPARDLAREIEWLTDKHNKAVSDLTDEQNWTAERPETALAPPSAEPAVGAVHRA